MTNTSLQKEKLLYLESLRGFAALIVAVFHAQFLKGSFVTESFIQYGYIMVDFFFVLSGFVIAYNYIDKIHSWQNLWVFQARRFLRLYPLHFIMLIAFIGVECAKYIFEQKTGVVANNPAFSSNDWGAAINNLFLTQVFFEDKGTFNEPSWSISAEFYTYLVFAVILLVRGAWVKYVLFAAAIIIGASYSWWQPYLAPEIPEMAKHFFRCLYAFFLGVFVFLLTRRWSALSLPGWFGYLALISAFSTLFTREYLPMQAMPLFFAFTIFALYFSGVNLAKSVLEKPFLVFFGTISYGIYMIHELVWWVISNGLKHGLKIDVDFTSWQVAIIIMGGIGVTIFLSWASYRLVEMPVNAYRHRLQMKS